MLLFGGNNFLGCWTSGQEGNHTEAVPLSTKQIESLSTKFVPKTADSTKWAIHIFTGWVQERNRCPYALTDCPADLFDYTKVTNGHKWAKSTSMATPSRYWTLAGSFCHWSLQGRCRPLLPCITKFYSCWPIQVYERNISPNTPTFLSRTDARFSMFKNALDR